METVQQITLFFSKFHSNTYSILFDDNSQRMYKEPPMCAAISGRNINNTLFDGFALKISHDIFFDNGRCKMNNGRW